MIIEQGQIPDTETWLFLSHQTIAHLLFIYTVLQRNQLTRPTIRDIVLSTVYNHVVLK